MELPATGKPEENGVDLRRNAKAVNCELAELSPNALIIIIIIRIIIVYTMRHIIRGLFQRASQTES